jgi:hypothetical protein
MAAGLGFKDFVTGEVLTAADVDGYLMQGVWVFASAAARDSAVTSPQEGNFAYLKDTNVTTYYTGSAWANLDTTGMTNPMTTTGDTIYSSSGSTPARLGIGTTGQVLTVSGGVPSWATPAGGSSFSGARLWNTTTQNISNATNTAITFDSESYDTNTYHSTATNTSRLTVPSTGYYRLDAEILFDANATGGRFLSIKKNNTTEIAYVEVGAATQATVGTSVSISCQISATASDYFEVLAYQTSGGTRNTYVGGQQYNFFSIQSLGA